MRNFLNNLKNKFINFMYGRYGADDFYKFLMILTYALIFINLFAKNGVISLLILFLLIYNTFRAFSKNHNARYQENQRFIKIKNKFVSFFKLQKRKITEKDYVFKTCPNCKQKLRLPKRKGKHTVTCPKCHKDFEVRI